MSRARRRQVGGFPHFSLLRKYLPSLTKGEDSEGLPEGLEGDMVERWSKENLAKRCREFPPVCMLEERVMGEDKIWRDHYVFWVNWKESLSEAEKVLEIIGKAGYRAWDKNVVATWLVLPSDERSGLILYHEGKSLEADHEFCERWYENLSKRADSHANARSFLFSGDAKLAPYAMAG